MCVCVSHFPPLCICVCVFHLCATELSPLPYHGEFQSRGRDELVWNKLAVLTAQTAPALGYKLKQKKQYLHISASSPWNPIRSASIFNVQQTERLPSFCPSLHFSLCSQAVPLTTSSAGISRFNSGRTVWSVWLYCTLMQFREWHGTDREYDTWINAILFFFHLSTPYCVLTPFVCFLFVI